MVCSQGSSSRGAPLPTGFRVKSPSLILPTSSPSASSAAWIGLPFPAGRTRARFETAFGYALGFSYDIRKAPRKYGHGGHHDGGLPLVASMEMYGGLGDTKSFGIMPEKQKHYLAPVVIWHAYNVMLHVSPAIGLADASDKYLLRAAIGWEF